MSSVGTVIVAPVRTLPLPGFDALLDESLADGHRMLRRLAEEWRSGANRFAAPGETLLAAFADGTVIGVCGRNRDPYTAAPRVGRVRHLYVRRARRRQGVGRRLLAAIADGAATHFDLLRLRTDDPRAAAFYAACGFARPHGDPSATHALRLSPETSAQ